MPVLDVYVREGCHLCEDMLENLELYAEQIGYTYVPQDVDSDPALTQKYNDAVPVVELEGEELFRYFFELKTLQLRLA